MNLDDCTPMLRSQIARAHELLDELIENCEASGDFTELDALFEYLALTDITPN
jgi:hypothetical protein